MCCGLICVLRLNEDRVIVKYQSNGKTKKTSGQHGNCEVNLGAAYVKWKSLEVEMDANIQYF